MKKVRISAVILAISIALTCTAFSSCADSTNKVGKNKPDAEKYIDDAIAWVHTLSDYAHREYRAGDNVEDINILYLGYLYCMCNAEKISELIISGSDEYPGTISITGDLMNKVCRNLIASDFSLSNYHPTLDNSADEYYSKDDLYMFCTGTDYWQGDNFITNDGATAYVRSDGRIAVNACVYYSPGICLAENFRMLEYILEPIYDGENIYFKLLQITDKGSAKGLTKAAEIDFSSYQNLNDLTYPMDGVDWSERPTVAVAKLSVPMTWCISRDEILVDVEREDYNEFVRCMQFELIKVDNDYTLTHDIHDRRTTEEMRKYRDSYEAAVVWRFYDDYDRASGKTAAGYEYVSYFKDYVEDDGTKCHSEQLYYRISDEYVLSVYYGADKDVAETVKTALDNMTVEVK